MQVGTQHEHDAKGEAAQGADDAVQPHARVEPGHPGADERDDEHVEHQVTGQRHRVGQRCGGPVAVDAGREHAQRVAQRADGQRNAEGRPGDPLGADPHRSCEAAPGGSQVGQIEQDGVVGAVPRQAGGPAPQPGGEQGRQTDGENERPRGSPRRPRRLLLVHDCYIDLRPRQQQAGVRWLTCSGDPEDRTRPRGGAPGGVCGTTMPNRSPGRTRRWRTSDTAGRPLLVPSDVTGDDVVRFRAGRQTRRGIRSPGRLVAPVQGVTRGSQRGTFSQNSSYGGP